MLIFQGETSSYYHTNTKVNGVSFVVLKSKNDMTFKKLTTCQQQCNFSTLWPPHTKFADMQDRNVLHILIQIQLLIYSQHPASKEINEE